MLHGAKVLLARWPRLALRIIATVSIPRPLAHVNTVLAVVSPLEARSPRQICCREPISDTLVTLA